MVLPDPNVKCPATGFARSCREIVAGCDCPKFVKISGTNPNDGQPVDRFGCVDAFLPMLLIENSLMQRQTGAAVESFRNEMVKANAASLTALVAVARAEAGTPWLPRLMMPALGDDAERP
jgi:hypothetical protein